MNRTARVARHVRAHRATTAALLALVFGAGPLFAQPATAQSPPTPARRAAPTTIAIDQVEFQRSVQVRIDRAGAAVHTNAGAQWMSPDHDGVTTKNWPVAYNMNTPIMLKAQFFVTGRRAGRQGDDHGHHHGRRPDPDPSSARGVARRRRKPRCRLRAAQGQDGHAPERGHANAAPVVTDDHHVERDHGREAPRFRRGRAATTSSSCTTPTVPCS